MLTRKVFVAIIYAVCLSPLIPAIGGDVDRLPEAKTQNGVNYLFGGVGLDESEAIAAAAKDYSLMLTFATKSGDYLAEVRVQISETSGAIVLDVVADGPMLLVQLQPGQYKISAVSNERQITKPVHISGNRTTKVTLHWPDDTVE